MMYPGMGLVVLVLDIYVIYLIATGSGDTGTKLGWVILVLFLPILGPILYLLLRHGGRRA
jgi:hypothetical protein